MKSNNAWKIEISIWIAVQGKHVMKSDCPGNWISKLFWLSQLKYGHVYSLNTCFSTSL